MVGGWAGWAGWAVLPTDNSSLFAISCNFLPSDDGGWWTGDEPRVVRRGGRGGGGCSQV